MRHIVKVLVRVFGPKWVIWAMTFLLGMALGCGGKKTVNTPSPFPGAQTSHVAKPPVAETADQRIIREMSENQAFLKRYDEASPDEKKVLLQWKRIHDENEAKAEVKSHKLIDDAEMRKARKVVEKDDKILAKRAKVHEQAMALAAISVCEESSVWVNPNAEDFKYNRDRISFTVHNESGGPIEIRTGLRGIGVAVKNLCARGSMALYFSGQYTLQGQSENFTLTAVSSTTGKVLSSTYGFIQSYSQSGYQYVRRDSQDWYIR